MIKKQQGFIMPTVIFMIVIMSLVAFAALVQANNVLNLSYKQAYIQMVRVSAKSGVDYAQEQFNANNNYSGTAETTILNNGRYRVTFKVDVLSTSSDGLEKSLKSTGNLYIPEISTTAKYVFDVRAEIVRTYAISKQPSDFANLLLWLDSSKSSSLIKNTASTTSLSPTPTTSFGSASNSTRDTMEELATDGSQSTNSWQSTDLETSYCDSSEFSSSICSSGSTRRQYVGMIFQNLAIPKNATIVSATLGMTGASPAGTSGSVTHRYWGFYRTTTNPSPTLFTSGASSQLRTKYNTSGLRTSASVDDTSSSFPPGNTRSIDVTSIAQEIVNNANWTSGSNMGLTAEYVSGSGVRKPLKNGMTLNITYSTSGTAQANNGDSVAKWTDARNNGIEALSTHGNVPTKVDNQINSLPIVRFNNGNMLSTLTSAVTSNEFTVIGVLKPNFSTSSTNGRVVSGMNSGQTTDSTTAYAIQALRRNGTSSGFANQYDTTSSHGTSFTCAGAFICANTPVVISANFNKQSNNSVTATVRENGTDQATANFTVSPTSYTFNIDQLWIGGRRNGSGAGSGQDWLNGDYAEIAVYNTQLTCQQIFAIEEYLRAKWAIAASPWSNTCPADNVPVL